MSNPLNFKFGGSKRLVEEVTAQRLNAMLDEIRRSRPLPGAGISLRQESNGVRIDNIARSEGGSPVRIAPHPFQILASLDEGGGATVRVRPGTINSVLPNNLIVDGRLATFEVSDALNYVVLTAASNGQQIVSASVAMSPSAPEPQVPAPFGLPTTASFVLGLTKGAAVFQTVNNSIFVAGRQQYIISKTAASPGELPYTIYYAWA
jgi:hypothetical protein